MRRDAAIGRGAAVVAALVCLAGAVGGVRADADAPAADGAAAGAWTMMNPTGRVYQNELVRLRIALPDDIGDGGWIVREDGREVPWQLDQRDGERFAWVLANLEAQQDRHYTLVRGVAGSVQPRVLVERADDAWVLDNGITALRIAAALPAGDDDLPAPVLQVRLPDGRWVGRGFWKTDRPLRSFSSTLIGDGALFAAVRIRYEFEGTGGLFDEDDAFHEVDITLAPGRQHAVIEERFAMGRHEHWELDIAEGWEARGAIVRPHFGGFGRPTLQDPEGNDHPWPPDSLKVGQTRMGDVLLNLIPRWSQSYDDGWFFAAVGERHAVGAIPVRAGRWEWPHGNMIQVRVRPSADYAGLRCPTWRGGRYWFLVVGEAGQWSTDAARNEYVLRHAVEGLDKLHWEYILDWPGLQPPPDANLTALQRETWGSGAGRFARRNVAFAGWGPGVSALERAGSSHHPPDAHPEPL